MSFSDQDIMMIENLTYLTGGNAIKGSSFEPSVKPFKSVDKCATMAEYLNQFSDEMLAQLDKQSKKTYNGEISGSEWAAMIRHMKSNANIYNLKVADYNKDVGALCFVASDGQPIVAFVGTKDGAEWIDNVEGLNRSDTECQKAALDYINSLPYDDIIVTGHSKGGNKAQYVTICAPEGKVKQCVSLDGQGFSQEFYDKYGHLVQERANRIKNYSLSSDFVNILLFPVPGSQQIYVDGGKDVGTILENHSPNAFFDYYRDENGNWVVVVNSNGDPTLNISGNKSDLAILQDFVAFFMNNASDEEKKLMIDFLSQLLAGVRSQKWTKEQIIEYLMTNQEALALFMAYLIKYMEVFDISQPEVVAMLDALGISDALLVALGVADHFFNISALIEFIYKNLTDGKRDWIIETLLKFLGDAVGHDIEKVWRKIEETYGDLDDVKKDSSKAKIKIYDYSQACYNAIIESINAFRRQPLPQVSEWNNYGSLSWFGRLSVALFSASINGYAREVNEVCNKWENKTNEKFNDIWEADGRFGGKIKGITEKVNFTKAKVQVNLIK